MFLGLSKIYNLFLDLIYNRSCLICNCSKTDELLCKKCAKDVVYMGDFAHRIYKEVSIYSATVYDGVIKKLIHKLKFNHNKNASKVLSNILFNYFKKLNLKDDFIIIYPDTFYLKSFTRGYNPVYLIANEFSKLTDFTIYKNVINKVKATKPQYKAHDRFKNIKGSFRVNKKYIELLKDKNILLIDDITTSGATIEEILEELFKYNIKNITCLTVAKA